MSASAGGVLSAAGGDGPARLSGQPAAHRDDVTHLLSPDPAWSHPVAYRFRVGELGKQLEASATPVGIEPLQLWSHVAESDGAASKRQAGEQTAID